MNGQLDRLKALIDAEKSFKKIKVSCFLSGLTENGKSFCLYNYAYQLALNQKKILIIDRKESTFCLTELINGEILQEERIIDPKNKFEKFLQKMSDNLYVLILSDLNERDDNQLNKVISEIVDHSSFDEIIINFRSGQSDGYFNSSIVFDEIFIICTPEAVSIIDAYAILKILLKKGYRNKIIVIINKNKSIEEYNEAAENLKKAAAHFLKYDLSFIKALPIVNMQNSFQSLKIPRDYSFLDENLFKSNSLLFSHT